MSVEYLTYYLQTLNWLSVECFEQSPSDKCVKFLLVADPQLVGEALENSFNSFFSQWDSDRCLKNHKTPNQIKTYYIRQVSKTDIFLRAAPHEA
jgi:hypothetical protein